MYSALSVHVLIDFEQEIDKNTDKVDPSSNVEVCSDRIGLSYADDPMQLREAQRRNSRPQ